MRRDTDLDAGPYVVFSFPVVPAKMVSIASPPTSTALLTVEYLGNSASGVPFTVHAGPWDTDPLSRLGNWCRARVLFGELVFLAIFNGSKPSVVVSPVSVSPVRVGRAPATHMTFNVKF
jgi:hypothetical protein